MIIADLGQAAAFLGLYLFVFLLAKWMKDVCTPYKINEELTKKDNVAISLIMSGYYLGAAAIFIGAMLGPSFGFGMDLILVGGYSILGLVFLNISRAVNDRVILRKFCNIKQLIDERNIAVGAVQFGTYLATGLIAAGAVMGTGGGVETAVVFFILGQISLLIFSQIYEWFAPYSIHEELAKKNLACGIALAGSLIALGIIITNGVAGDFVSWEDNLLRFVQVNILAFVFLPIIRFMMDFLIVPGDRLSREIIEDQNVGAGLLEAAAVISFACLLKVVF